MYFYDSDLGIKDTIAKNEDDVPSRAQSVRRALIETDGGHEDRGKDTIMATESCTIKYNTRQNIDNNLKRKCQYKWRQNGDREKTQ